MTCQPLLEDRDLTMTASAPTVQGASRVGRLLVHWIDLRGPRGTRSEARRWWDRPRTALLTRARFCRYPSVDNRVMVRGQQVPGPVSGPTVEDLVQHYRAGARTPSDTVAEVFDRI